MKFLTVNKLFYPILLLSLCGFFQQAQAQCHMDDWTALKAIYESTNIADIQRDLSNWDETFLLREMPKPNCNLAALAGLSLNESGRLNKMVMALDLGIPKSFGLTGSLPPEIGNLSELEILDLSTNALSGGIPEEIGNLIKLTSINFNRLRIGGNIPATIGNLKNLKMLDLSYCTLTGSIPTSIGELSNLT